MLNKIILLVVTINLFTYTPGSAAKSDSVNKNKSRAKSLLQVRSDASNFEFYPANVGGGQQIKKHLLKLDSTAYVLPEPGCTCVPRIQDCDFECCYCELNCPLPKSSTYGGDWLTSLYGNGCKGRKSDQQNAGISGRQRRLVAWRNIWSFCDKPEHYMNAQMTSFPFICIYYDNSHTSLHYSLTPPRPNLIRMTNLTPVKYTWPFTQRFYNKCLPMDNPDKDDSEKSIDKSYRLLLLVRQLFYLPPPPPQSMNNQKGQLSHDKLCLSQRKRVDEITAFQKKTVRQMSYQQDTFEILGKVVLS
ncbi:unnamed protein product [Allacma fusca]|uniref:Tectonic domain-containing protein n=1 Tax=Allacma fusca TaxID=39272 RepID=A0A8J2LEX5_9HEXA|nr:unnamed protein product [Allacma fusca]